MPRYVSGKQITTQKPASEIQALISILADQQPDILGICEIGTDDDLTDFQTKLRRAGVDLPHSRRGYGADRRRSLAILSRFPIVAWKLPEKTNYKLNGRTFSISRGILDTTIQLPGKQFRMVGVHLKSKRPVEDADQESMRRNESMLLRQHLENIIKQSPKTNLIVYGDFNDTKASRSIYSIRGRPNSPDHMQLLDLADANGHRWTHYWKREDVYSRFDYIMANEAAMMWIDRKQSCILSPRNWLEASDHRPISVIIR